MTKEQKGMIVVLQQRGFGYRKIAEETGLPMEAVKTYCRRHPITEADGKRACANNVMLFLPLSRTARKSASARMPAGWPGGKLTRSLSKGIRSIRPFVNVAEPLSTVFDKVRGSALVNAMPISGERRSTMDEDLRKRVIAYRVAMSIIRGLVLDGTIS